MRVHETRLHNSTHAQVHETNGYTLRQAKGVALLELARLRPRTCFAVRKDSDGLSCPSREFISIMLTASTS